MILDLWYQLWPFYSFVYLPSYLRCYVWHCRWQPLTSIHLCWAIQCPPLQATLRCLPTAFWPPPRNCRRSSWCPRTHSQYTPPMDSPMPLRLSLWRCRTKTQIHLNFSLLRYGLDYVDKPVNLQCSYSPNVFLFVLTTLPIAHLELKILSSKHWCKSYALLFGFMSAFLLWFTYRIVLLRNCCENSPAPYPV